MTIDHLAIEAEAFRIVCDMEDLVDEVRTRKTLLLCIATSEAADGRMMRECCNQLGYDLSSLYDELEAKRGRLFHILHPHRETLDQEAEAEREDQP